MQTLQNGLNTPFLHDREYVAFTYLEQPSGTAVLVMAFDHRLLDARGAEMFLDMFCQYVSGSLPNADLERAAAPVQPSLLNRWGERFASGRSLIRATLPYTDCTIARLADGGNAGSTRFIHVALDESESKEFIERAYRAAGFLMFMPYALSLAVRLVEDLLREAGRDGDLVIPCTTDLRGSEASAQQTFFNYCAMLFFHVSGEERNDRSNLIASLKTQFYEQCKAGLPQHFEKVMALMRILPVRWFDRIICSKMTHCFGSFSFASLTSVSLAEGRFCGVPVRNLYHMPHVPPQTGIGFVFNQFQGRINVGISVREQLIDAAGRTKLQSRLQTLCLGEK